MSQTRASSAQFGFFSLRLYVLAAVFVTLDVALPSLFQRVGLGGPVFLPMHLFALLAGLVFGWRVGLLVGLTTPTISYGISGLPPHALLLVTAEISVYGVGAGILRQVLKGGTLLPLVGAMALGRLALFVAEYALDVVPATPLAYVWSATTTGLPGIALQLLLVPFLVRVFDCLIAASRAGDARQRRCAA